MPGRVYCCRFAESKSTIGGSAMRVRKGNIRRLPPGSARNKVQLLTAEQKSFR